MRPHRFSLVVGLQPLRTQMREPMPRRIPAGRLLPELLSRIRELERKQTRIVGRLDSLEIAADGVAAGLREVAMTLEVDVELASTGQIPSMLHKELRKTRQSLQRVRESLRKVTQVSIDSLEVKRHFDASSEVTINKVKSLRLTPALTHLIDVLSANRVESEDDLVAWKTLSDVCQELKKRPRAVVQLIFRLRKELERAGLSGHLIQHSVEKGYRFALRRHVSFV